MTKKIFLFLLCSAMYTIANAQDDSMEEMIDSSNVQAPKKAPIKVFTATRIINGNSVANLDAGVLDFRISHRFGKLSEGSQNFYGLDDATTRVGLDYGITKWLMVGIGHSVLNKEDDGFMKIALLRQRPRMPVSLSYGGEISEQMTPAPTLPAGDKWLLDYRLYYTNQLLIARKFTDWLSLQLMPTIVHYNLVDSAKFSNNTIAIGIGGRIKITKLLSVTGEYYYRLTNATLLYDGLPTYNALSLGFEIESGGHVFQMVLTNSQGLTGRSFIGQTTDNWAKGQLHFGFNISRVFRIIKPKDG